MFIKPFCIHFRVILLKNFPNGSMKRLRENINNKFLGISHDGCHQRENEGKKKCRAVLVQVVLNIWIDREGMDRRRRWRVDEYFIFLIMNGLHMEY